jgi:hypothetical protein
MRFGKQFTTAGFKTAYGITDLKVLRNPKTEKLFLSGDGQTVGSVSHKIDLKGQLAVVEIIDSETGDIVPCLMNPGAGGAEVVMAL